MVELSLENKRKLIVSVFLLELELGRGRKTIEEETQLFIDAADKFALLGADE